MKYSFAPQFLSLLLCSLLIVSPRSVVSQENSTNTTQDPAALTATGSDKLDDYLQGKMDGKHAVKGNPLWVLAGLTGTGFCLLIGVAGIGVAAIAAPNPPEQALMGQSSNYVIGYTEAYKSKGRWLNVAWASTGCAIAGVLNIIINVASGNVPTNK
ncbi:MAG: hypothetical protein JW795_06230 [Chitinivibrionales bacterium]|nr:hypothetical protein [Chitinivibrionales bacterium]